MGLLGGSTLGRSQHWLRPNTRERRWVVSAGRDVPREFHVSLETGRYVTALFLDVLHDVRLVHHVPLAIRDDVFKVVREELSADIDSEHAFKGGFSRDGLCLPFHSVPHDRS